MTKISINLKWSLNGGELSPGKYSNKHQIEFNDEIYIGDACPRLERETNKIAILNKHLQQRSSCHMMTFLALAKKWNWPVSAYTDNAIATLGKVSKGKMSVTSIELNPKVEFSKEFSVNENKNE